MPISRMKPEVVASNVLTSDLKTDRPVPDAPAEAQLGKAITSVVAGSPKTLAPEGPWSEVKQYANGATLSVQPGLAMLKVPTASGERVYFAGDDLKVNKAIITEGGKTMEFGDANVDGKLDSLKAQGWQLGVTRANFAGLVTEDQFDLAPGLEINTVTLRDTNRDGKFDQVDLGAGDQVDWAGWKRKP
ncbi:MAG: hypothetical protein ACOZQL_02080 [Myxococcota bacterium]